IAATVGCSPNICDHVPVRASQSGRICDRADQGDSHIGAITKVKGPWTSFRPHDPTLDYKIVGAYDDGRGRIHHPDDLRASAGVAATIHRLPDPRDHGAIRTN